MKKIYLPIILVFIIFNLFNVLSNRAISNPTGAPAGNTGSPSDGTTCAESCHGGSAVTTAGMITSNIPVGGYVPGSTYTITLTSTGSGNKGFQVSPQNIAGTKLGNLIAGSGTQIVSLKYLTHTTPKTTATAVWTFQWIAPAAGTGTVTFYGAFAITQASTKKSTLVVNEAVVVAPQINSFNPTSAAIGATVTITGTNFTNASAVKFGNTAAASFSVVNSTTITAVVANGTSGNISVTTPGGTSNLAGFTFLAAPSISNFTPQVATTNETITINGSNFTGTTAVTFGGTAAASFNVINSSTIEAVVGAGSSGAIMVTNPGGNNSLVGFTYIPAANIASFTPFVAKTNDTVSINGTNFLNISAVSFGGVPAISFQTISTTLIKAVVGAGASGDVSIVNAAGNSTLSGFIYITVPSINSFSPTSGYSADTITILGSNFDNVSSVSFGLVNASSFTIENSNTIKAIVATGSSGSIEVISATGSSLLPGFTYLETPQLFSFSPDSARQGDTITITGANLTSLSEVKFGGIAAKSFNLISSNQIQAVVDTGNSGTIEVALSKFNLILNGFIYIKTISSVSQTKNNFSLQVYPNPSQNQITFEIPISNTNSRLRMMNTEGKIVLEKEIPSNSQIVKVSLEQLSIGVYLLEWTNGENRYTTKIIKQL